MTNRDLILSALLLASLFLPTTVLAQSRPNQVGPSNDTGLQPYTTYGGVRENINLSNGNLNLQISPLTLPGRKGHDLSPSLEYDSKIYQLHYDNGGTTGQPTYWWDYESHT